MRTPCSRWHKTVAIGWARRFGRGWQTSLLPVSRSKTSYWCALPSPPRCVLGKPRMLLQYWAAQPSWLSCNLAAAEFDQLLFNVLACAVGDAPCHGDTAAHRVGRALEGDPSAQDGASTSSLPTGARLHVFQSRGMSRYLLATDGASRELETLAAGPQPASTP